MTVDRTQARNLLMPGIRQKVSDTNRAPFTDDEIESAVDAYCDGGVDSAVARIGELCALPLSARRQQAALAPLRSVSAAYRQSKLPVHLRSNQEHFYEPRKSVKAPACRATQSGSPGRDGGAEAAARVLAVAKYRLEQQRLTYDIQRYNQGVSTSAAYYGNNLGAQNSLANLYGGAQQAGANQPFTVYNTYNSALQAQGVMWPYGPPEPEKPLPVEIKAGELIAWRCWRMIGGGKLCSMTQPTVWEEGVPQEGDIDAGVGIHAWKTEAEARMYACSYYQYEPVAIGTVELWGQVIEHEEGYRAQFGQIKEIVERMAAHKVPFGMLGSYPTPALARHRKPFAVWSGIAGALFVAGGMMAVALHPMWILIGVLGMVMFAVAAMAPIDP